MSSPVSESAGLHVGPERRFTAIRHLFARMLWHSEWAGWGALSLALFVLLVRLGSADDASLGKWISSDTLYPVNVFIDVFRDHYSISGWRFSIAPCWFPDLAATGVFWGITGNPILGTLLGGFVQIPVIVACFHLIGRAIGIRMLFLQDTLLLACGTGLTLYVAAHPDTYYPALYEFFLPQTHVGSMLLVLGGWGMGLRIIREERQAGRVQLWFTAAYAVLCLCAGMSNILFFPHMLLPLTAALALAIFFGLMSFRQSWLPVVVGWFAAALGAILERLLFTSAPVSLQSALGFEPALTALDVFIRGFVSGLLRGDMLHICAILWAVVCIGYMAWLLRRLVMRGISLMTDSQLLMGLFFAMCLISSVSSAGAIIIGGSNGLVQLKDYVWSMHYLHQIFLVPLFGLAVSAAWACDKVLNTKAAATLAWIVATVALVLAATRLIAAPWPITPIYAYRPPLVRFVDEIAREKNLHQGYGGYWQARLVTLLSSSGVRAYAVDGVMNPLLWANNSEWYRQSLENRARPPRVSFVILDDPLWKLTREAAVSKFGEPYEEAQVQGTRILIYSRGNQ